MATPQTRTEFTVYGTVLGKPRPRFANGRCYTPKKFVDYEREIAKAYLRAGGKKTDHAVEVEILIARSLPKNRKKSIEWEEDTFKPDIDNIIKIILDGLNGVAYIDDTQVVSVKATKTLRMRNTTECVKVRVTEKETVCLKK